MPNTSRVSGFHPRENARVTMIFEREETLTYYLMSGVRLVCQVSNSMVAWFVYLSILYLVCIIPSSYHLLNEVS